MRNIVDAKHIHWFNELRVVPKVMGGEERRYRKVVDSKKLYVLS